MSRSCTLPFTSLLLARRCAFTKGLRSTGLFSFTAPPPLGVSNGPRGGLFLAPAAIPLSPPFLLSPPPPPSQPSRPLATDGETEALAMLRSRAARNALRSASTWRFMRRSWLPAACTGAARVRRWWKVKARSRCSGTPKCRSDRTMRLLPAICALNASRGSRFFTGSSWRATTAGRASVLVPREVKEPLLRDRTLTGDVGSIFTEGSIMRVMLPVRSTLFPCGCGGTLWPRRRGSPAREPRANCGEPDPCLVGFAFSNGSRGTD